VRFRVGERVRVIASEDPYTGCRGTVAEAPSEVPDGADGDPLGCYVAIDGENGRTRPFLAVDLERIPVARARSRPSPARTPAREQSPDG
jgi:hypothetical protein